MQGYVKVFRTLLQWEWYRDQNTKALFLHLLLMACYKNTRYKGVDIPRGSYAATVGKLAQETGMSVKCVRTALEHLQSTGEVAIEATNRFSVLRIVRYDVYQEPEEEKGQTCGQTGGKQTANEGQTKGKPSEEESKKVRKEEKDFYAEFVSLTETEFRSLRQRAGEEGARRCIELLDNYKGANGRQYRSDYRAILSWVLARYEKERKEQAGKERNRSYCLEELEDLSIFSPLEESAQGKVF